MLIINNEQTTDDYRAALTLESLRLSKQDVQAEGGGRLAFTVANASVVARFRPLYDKSAVSAEYGPEQLVTPSTGTIDNISGVKYRSAVAGAPARVIASLSEPGDIVPSNAVPFGQTIAPSGASSGVLVTNLTALLAAAVAISAINTPFDSAAIVLPANTSWLLWSWTTVQGGVNNQEFTARLWNGVAAAGEAQTIGGPGGSRVTTIPIGPVLVVVGAANETWKTSVYSTSAAGSILADATLNSLGTKKASGIGAIQTA